MKACILVSLIVATSGIANAQEGQAGGPAEAPKTELSGNPLHPRVRMETTLGDILLELDAERAPITVENFLRYAETGFFDGTVFHRVMAGFMIQGGQFTPEMEKKTAGLRPPIKNEWQNGLKNVRGTIAMARQGGQPDSATSQFFINVVPNAKLDRPQRDGAAYAVFGHVVDGMDVVDAIRHTQVEHHPKYRSPRPVTPVEPVIIRSVSIVEPCDRAKIAAAAQAVQEKYDREKAAAKAEREKQGAAARAEREKPVLEYVEKLEAELGKKIEQTPSGLRYVVLQEGDGPTPAKTDKVEVHYTGWLLDGTKFDSSVDRGRPFPFSLTGGVIQGWLEGVALMKVGEKRKLIIPPELGYKEKGSGRKVPPNAYLVFDVELLSIK